MSWIGVTVTEEIAVPVPEAESVDAHGGLGGSDAPYDSTPLEPDFEPEYEIETQTIEVQSLLDVEGLRFIFTSFVEQLRRLQLWWPSPSWPWRASVSPSTPA